MPAGPGHYHDAAIGIFYRPRCAEFGPSEGFQFRIIIWPDPALKPGRPVVDGLVALNTHVAGVQEHDRAQHVTGQVSITHKSRVVARGKKRVDKIRRGIIAPVAITDAQLHFSLGDVAVMYQMSVMPGQVVLEQEDDWGGFV